MELHDHSWTEIRDMDVDVAVLPVGSTEQHGPHNPLGVDAIAAKRLAQEACAETDALCLPSIDVGIAEHHRNFDGTLYVSHDTLRDYVTETLQSLTHHGIERVVVVNGHGGNSAALEEACARLTRDGDLYAVVWEWFRTRDEPVGHGGEYETAMMMHLVPDLVGDPEKGDADSWGKTMNGATVAYDTDEFTKNGITGDPRNANPELGEKMFTESVEELVGLIDWLRDADWDSGT
jgi:creatinine amidohydrolase